MPLCQRPFHFSLAQPAWSMEQSLCEMEPHSTKRDKQEAFLSY